MFGLSPTMIARVVGCSRPYISRIISDADPLVGAPELYRRLEERLPLLVERRPCQFFRVPPLDVRTVERALADMAD